MKCFCQPPLPVVTRVSKTATNPGREFWACSKSGSGCGLFCWVGDPFPAYIKHQQSEASRNNAKIDPSKLKVTINFYEIILGPPSSAWFAVYHPYDAQLLQLYSTIDSQHQRYSDSLRLRTFNFVIYDSLLRSLKALSHVAVDELPSFLINGVKWYLRNLPTSPLSLLNLTPFMLDTLLPFQLEGVKFIVQRSGRGLIADDMGVGKTIQAIAILMHYRNKWPALVIAPPNLLIQWKKELLRFCGELLTDKDISVVSKGTDRPNGKISLVPYTLLGKVFSSSERAESFGIVIADESHNIKSRTSARAANAIPYLHQADVAVCLSGTPSLNRPEELFIPLHCLLPKVFQSYESFVMRYCDAKYTQPYGKLDARGASNISELKRLLESMVMLRRLKADVGQHIPEKSREVRYVHPEGVYAQQLKGLQREARALDKSLRECTDDGDRAVLANRQQQLLNKQYMVTGLCKISAVTACLQELIAEMRKQREVEAELALVAEAEAEAAVLVDGDAIIEEDAEWMQDDGEWSGKQTSQTLSSPQHRPRKASARVRDSPYSADRGARNQVISLLEDDLLTDDPITNAMCSSTESNELVDSDEDVSPKKPRITTPQRKRLKRCAVTPPSSKITSRSLLDNDLHDTPPSQSQRRSARLQSTQRSRLYDDDDDDVIEDDLFDDVTAVGTTIALGDVEEDIFFSDRKNKKSKKFRSMLKVPATPSSTKRENKAARTSSPAAVAAWKHVLNGDSSSSKPKRGSRKTVVTPVKAAAPKPLGAKIILFAHHQEVMDALEVRLREIDVGYMRIDGTVSMAARATLIDKFQDDNETDVALLSITATGTGLNLTRANVAIFAELVWSSGTLAQGEDRLHRLGQKSSVRIIYVLAEGSADDIVWAKLNEKQSVIGATVGAADTTVKMSEKSSKSSNGTKRKGPGESSSSGSQVSMDSFLQSSNSSKNVNVSNNSAQQAAPIVSNPSLIYGSAAASAPMANVPVTVQTSIVGSLCAVNPTSTALAQPSQANNSSEKCWTTAQSAPRSLSPATLQRIETNRLKALAKKEAKQKAMLGSSAVVPSAPAEQAYDFATAKGSTVHVDAKSVDAATHKLQLNEKPFRGPFPPDIPVAHDSICSSMQLPSATIQENGRPRITAKSID